MTDIATVAAKLREATKWAGVDQAVVSADVWSAIVDVVEAAGAFHNRQWTLEGKQNLDCVLEALAQHTTGR